MGRFLTTLPAVTSTMSTLSPPRIGTPTSVPSGVTAHWLGSPLSLTDRMIRSLAVSTTCSVWSPSTVVKRRRPSADTAAPCGRSPVRISPTTLKLPRSMTWMPSPALLVTYSFNAASFSLPPAAAALPQRASRRDGAEERDASSHGRRPSPTTHRGPPTPPRRTVRPLGDSTGDPFLRPDTQEVCDRLRRARPRVVPPPFGADDRP